MDLARVSQTAIEGAARGSGLSLTVEQTRDIAEVESACLSANRRITFGESAAVRLVREFAESPFIVGDGASMVLADLVEAFYELREDYPALVSDAEILEALGESFNGEAAGDVSLAAALASESLVKQLDYSTYEIADDEGNVYRWDSKERSDDAIAGGWCDDVTADAWRENATTDANGNVYRWNPEEWRDDVMADGWYGERWEDADE